MKEHRYVVDEYHKYGLIRINATQYIKCSEDCCKSGGPAFQDERDRDD